MFEMFNKDKELKEAKEAQTKQNSHEQKQNILSGEASPQAEQMYYVNQNDKSDLLRWQQDITDEQFSMIMTLKAMHLDEDNKWKPIPGKRPLCNDLFIYEVVLPQCKPFSSRNMFNSNLNEDTILMMLRRTHNEIADAMADGYHKYDIKFTDYDMVVRLIKNTNIPGSFRPLNGWNKRIDSTVTKRVETLNPLEENKKEGFAALFGK